MLFSVGQGRKKELWYKRKADDTRVSAESYMKRAERLSNMESKGS